jgi:hypothetical protein
MGALLHCRRLHFELRAPHLCIAGIEYRIDRAGAGPASLETIRSSSAAAACSHQFW